MVEKQLNFMKEFQKELSNMEGVGVSSAPPRYWYSSGNYVLNKIISGSCNRGIPQGRITDIAGPSSSGKSFLTANIIRSAQEAGAIILVVDSENALDDQFMTDIGVNVNENYTYASVTTIAKATAVISGFIKHYKKEWGSDVDAPQVLIALDSLDMLLTETELENYEKGVQKGDQGQRNKQLKAMLRSFVQDIKNLNIAMIVTSQVYKNQDMLNGEGTWIVSDAVKYSASQIILLNKLKLKDTGSSVVKGINMKCEGYKTRFTKPFQKVTIEVPYEEGMDPYSGLKDTAIAMNIIEKAGSRYRIVGEEQTWYERDIGEVAERIINAIESQRDAYLATQGEEEIDMDVETTEDTSNRRKAKAVQTTKSQG